MFQPRPADEGGQHTEPFGPVFVWSVPTAVIAERLKVAEACPQLPNTRIDGCGHWVMVEHPERVARKRCAFLPT